MKYLSLLLPPLVWMALIFVLSSQQHVPHAFGFSIDFLAVVGHLFLYGVLLLLVFRALVPLQGRLTARAALALAFSVLYGISDELHQSFVPGRDPALFDVMVDFVGASLVLAATVLVVRRWGQAHDE